MPSPTFAHSSLEDRQVGFRWRDYRHHDKVKTMTLTADQFIRRFLLHSLPDGFHRIRHYGVLANRHRAAKLALCRQLLAMPPPAPLPQTDDREQFRQLTGLSLDICPCCAGAMVPLGRLPPLRRHRGHSASIAREPLSSCRHHGAPRSANSLR
jgi:hypothetical protein